MRATILAAATAVVAATIGYAAGHAEAAPADPPPLICGAYTQANDAMDGCELLPGYDVVAQ